MTGIIVSKVLSTTENHANYHKYRAQTFASCHCHRQQYSFYSKKALVFVLYAVVLVESSSVVKLHLNSGVRVHSMC